jgi:hypothetical protein
MEKRGGFSLIIVLILSIMGLAIVGVMLQLTAASSGAGIMATRGGHNYNMLSSEIENARATLAERLSDDIPAPRYFDPGGSVSETGDVTALDMLVIPGGVVKDRALTTRELAEFGLKDASRLVVKIYDMQYEPSLIKIPTDADDFNLLPARVPVVGTGGDRPNDEPGGPPLPVSTGDSIADNAGSYLIRAMFEGQGGKNLHSIEMAIIASTQKR